MAKFIKVTEAEMLCEVFGMSIKRREGKPEIVPLRDIFLSVDKIVYMYEYKENNIKYSVIVTNNERICVIETIEELQEKLKAVE